MKLITAVLLIAASGFAGDLKARFQTQFLDIQTDSSVNQSPALPGLGKTEHIVSISITSTDYAASAFCVIALVSLVNGGTAGVTSKCVDKDPFDGPVAIQFSTGNVAPVAWLRLLITRLHAEPYDQLVNTYRH